MNRRLLYKFKIVRLYEDDIWGIFFRKQKKRDLFFRKIGYQLFLEIFHKNIRIVKPTFFAWNKKIFASVSRYQGITRRHNKLYLTALARKTKYGFFLLNYTQNTYNLASTVRFSSYYLYANKPTSLSILRWFKAIKKKRVFLVFFILGI